MKSCLHVSGAAVAGLIMMAVLPTSHATRLLRGSNSSSASLWSQTSCSSSSDKPMYKKKDGTCWLWLGDPKQAPEGALNSRSASSSGFTSGGEWVRAACNSETEKYKKADGSCWSWTGPPEFKVNSWEAYFYAVTGRADPFANQPWPYAAEDQPADSTTVSTAAVP